MTYTQSMKMQVDPLSQAWTKYSQQTGLSGQDSFNAFRDKYQQAQTLPGASSGGNSLEDLLAQQEQKRLKSLDEQGLMPDGTPKGPEFNSGLNGDGTLKNQYQLSPWQTVNPDTAGYDTFKGEALRNAGTDSPWAKLQLEKLGVENAQRADDAAAGANNSMLSAVSRLAQTGGIGSGARERLLKQGAQQGFIQRQQVGRQGMLDKLGVQTQDEQNRVSGLKDLQGMSNQQADIQFKNQQQGLAINQYNNDNLLKATQGLNANNQNTYNQRMQAWAAGKSADAQRAASGGGGKKG